MQKRSVCFYTSNTGVGLVADVSLLQDILFDHYDIDVIYFNNSLKSPSRELTTHKKYDLGITKLSVLKRFDKIICKSTFGQQLLSPYNNNVVVSGFISKDRYNPTVKKENNFIHVMGKSAQKGTECVLNNFNQPNQKLPITIIESRDGCTLDKMYTDSNFNYIKGFITEEEMNAEFNKHSMHLCPSIYEGWGHYMYEALSTGALTYVTKIPMFLEWLDPDLVIFLDCKFEQLNPSRTNIHFLSVDRKNNTHQFGWLVDQNDLKENIENYKQHLEKHDPIKVRKFFLHLNQKNSNTLIEEITNV